MEIRKGTKKIKNKTIQSLADIKCSYNYDIFVFQGHLSPNDILIKYSENGKRPRTPKHIHWVVDILMKLQAEQKLTKDFLTEIKKCWNNSKPLENNRFDTIAELIEIGETNYNVMSFHKLDNYGEYHVDFLFVLMQLLIIQEKTNREDAYMFEKIIDALMADELDIFSIMSTAGFNGR